MENPEAYSGFVSAIIAALVSSLVIILGYIWQGRWVREQISAQNKASRKEVTFAAITSIVGIITNRAKDCNKIWDHLNGGQMGAGQAEQILRELIISKEVITKSLEIYGRQEGEILKDSKSFAYIFWKSLDVYLRGYFAKECLHYAHEMGKRETRVEHFYDVFIWVEKSMEQRGEMDKTKLQEIIEWMKQPKK